MASNLFNVSVETLTAFAATYWFHSTLLLGAAWLLLRTAKPDSHFVRERIWKFAAVTGLTTAAVQLATGLGISVFAEPDDSSESAHVFVPRIVNVGRSTETSNRTRSNLTHAEARQHLATSLQIVQDSLNDLGNGVPATLAASKLKDESTPSRESTSPPTMGANDPRSVASVTFLPLSEEAPSPTQKLAADNSSGVVSLDATAVSVELRKSESASTQDRWLPKAASGLALTWLSLSVLYLTWQSLRFRWQMRHVSEAAPSHRKLLDSIRETRGVTRKVRLLKSDRFEEPVAYGLFRPTILIPAQVEKRLNRDELAALLSHELAHLTRGDILWLVVGRVLTTCFAFQPLNFLARRRWQEHAEFQCDDWAVDRNVDRLTLARSLTLVAEWRAGRKSCAGVVSAGGARFHISDRVERLLAEPVPDRWRRGSRRLAIHLVSLLAAGTVIAFGPQTGNAEREAEDSKPDSASADSEADSASDVKKKLIEVPSEGISTEEISALIREVEGLSGDVSELLAELRTIEPLLAKLEQRPELEDQVSQLRTRIGLLRRLAEERSRLANGKEFSKSDDN
jgi:beta-lactamase regulating signal transducer with metallopeptidase domain